MGKCQCTSTDICLAVSTLTPLPPGFSISLPSLCGQLLLVCAAAINPLYALIVCVVHRAHFLCRLLLQLWLLATGRCWHFRCPGAKSSNAVCCSPPPASCLLLLFLAGNRRVMLTTYKCTSCWWTHTIPRNTYVCVCVCVVMHELSYHARSLPPSSSLSLSLSLSSCHTHWRWRKRR